jgi:hypothetical protein
MVDFPGPVSLIHCGLDAWPFDQKDINHREFVVDDEPRLASRLGVDFFVQPPDYRKIDFGDADDAVNLGLKQPITREWLSSANARSLLGWRHRAAVRNPGLPWMMRVGSSRTTDLTW